MAFWPRNKIFRKSKVYIIITRDQSFLSRYQALSDPGDRYYLHCVFNSDSKTAIYLVHGRQLLVNQVGIFPFINPFSNQIEICRCNFNRLASETAFWETFAARSCLNHSDKITTKNSKIPDSFLID